MISRQWFEKARKENFAIGAFNVDSLEIFKAVVMAALAKKSPVMVEFSPGEVGYFGLRNIVDLSENAKQETGVSLLLNLDHGKPQKAVMDAISHSRNGSGGKSGEHSGSESGFDNVHFDGSDLDVDENIGQTKEIVEAAHKKEILVEGEVNKIGGFSEVRSDELDLEEVKKSYTKPEEAKSFVTETGVDIFAAVIGNLHGTFPVQPDLDLELLGKIKEAVGETFISLHGGSGIPAVQVQEAIKVGGIVKVNVNTELRATYKQALEEKLGEHPDEYKIYDLMPDVVRAVAAVVEDKIEVFGSAGKA